MNGDHFREVEDEPVEDEDRDVDDGEDEVDSEQMDEAVDENALGAEDLADPRSDRTASQACRFGGGLMYMRRNSSSYRKWQPLRLVPVSRSKRLL